MKRPGMAGADRREMALVLAASTLLGEPKLWYGSSNNESIEFTIT
jgi:hypothetical protein